MNNRPSSDRGFSLHDRQVELLAEHYTSFAENWASVIRSQSAAFVAGSTEDYEMAERVGRALFAKYRARACAAGLIDRATGRILGRSGSTPLRNPVLA